MIPLKNQMPPTILVTLSKFHLMMPQKAAPNNDNDESTIVRTLISIWLLPCNEKRPRRNSAQSQKTYALPSTRSALVSVYGSEKCSWYFGSIDASGNPPKNLIIKKEL